MKGRQREAAEEAATEAAEEAAKESLGIFLSDGVTGDGMGLCMLGKSSHSACSRNGVLSGCIILLCVL